VKKIDIEFYKNIYRDRTNRYYEIQLYNFWRDFSLKESSLDKTTSFYINYYGNILSNFKKSSKTDVEKFRQQFKINEWDLNLFCSYIADFPKNEAGEILKTKYPLIVCSMMALAKSVKMMLPIVEETHEKVLKATRNQDEEEDINATTEVLIDITLNNFYTKKRIPELNIIKQRSTEECFDTLNLILESAIKRMTKDEILYFLKTELEQFERIFIEGESSKGWDYFIAKGVFDPEVIENLRKLKYDLVSREPVRYFDSDESTFLIGQLLGVERYINFLKSKLKEVENPQPIDENLGVDQRTNSVNRTSNGNHSAHLKAAKSYPTFELKTQCDKKENGPDYVNETFNQRMMLYDVYHFLVKHRFVSEETNKNQFSKLFLGEQLQKPMIWIGVHAELKHFFLTMSPILKSKNKMWVRVATYFLEEKGNSFNTKSLRQASLEKMDQGRKSLIEEGCKLLLKNIPH